MGKGTGTVQERLSHHSEMEIEAGVLRLSVNISRSQDGLVKVNIIRTSQPVQKKDEPLFMHWGVVLHDTDDKSKYIRPKETLWPEGTDPRLGEPSVQTPFKDGSLRFQIKQKDLPAGIVFLVLIRDGPGTRSQWFKGHRGSSFYVDLTSARTSEELKRRAREEEEAREREVRRLREEEEKRKAENMERERKISEEARKRIGRETDAASFIERELSSAEKAKWSVFTARDDNYSFGALSLRCIRPVSEAQPDVSAHQLPPPGDLLIVSTIASEGADVYLHWGVKLPSCAGWQAPDEKYWPLDTKKASDGKAVQTKLPLMGENGLRALRIRSLPPNALGVFAVIHIPNGPGAMQWIQAEKGGDIYIPVVPSPPLPGFKKGQEVSEICKEILEGIIEREMEYGSWTLMHRYNHANHLISNVIGGDQDAWSALYVWMRYSQIRVLDWQRRFNTQPRQLSHSQLAVVTLLANRFKNVPAVRWLVRLVMSCIGRGGSGDLGQRIRDDILVILRHHRDWKHGTMMEQWHQKLHNNTSPDDVIICDALISFWTNNGDISAYWNVIYSNGLTRERMAAYEQPITAEPDFPGHIKDTMLWELGRYGSLLKAVHLGTDLHSIVDRCQGILDTDVREKVNGFMHARGSGGSLTDILRAVSHARESLCNQLAFAEWLDDEKRRDLIFLDLAIESETRRCVESAGGVGHDGTLWSHLIAVRAAASALKSSEGGLRTAGELERAIHEVRSVVDRLGRQGESHDVGLRAAAALTIIRNVLTEIVDRYMDHLGPLSTCMGIAFRADKSIVSTFIEEAVRGGPAYTLSTLIRKAEPAVRRVARLGPFSVIAPHNRETKGPVVVFHKLRESVGQSFKRGTVVIADICDGDEDVPQNTAYVVIGSTVDVLSHVSVRARNERHGLVACLDAEKLAELRSLHGCIVRAKLTGDDFIVDVVDESGRMSPSVGAQTIMKRIKSSGIITPPSGMQTPPGGFLGLARKKFFGSLPSLSGRMLGRKLSDNTLRVIGQRKKEVSERQLAAPWAIRPSEFNSELVGSKSLNLQSLVALGLPEWIRTPPSVVIPYGAMRKVMGDPANADLEAEYQDLLEEVRRSKPGDVKLCSTIRDVIMSLEAPEGLREALRGILDDLGCEDIDDGLPGAWEAVKGVWASVWNARAHLARQKLRLDIDDVEMAVLCQKVIDADFAFVIHTKNPLSGDANEIYAEAVIGLGETLVGNAPGQALGFTVRKDQDLDVVTPIVRSYPSKRTALIGGEYIFRSDSNAEDLEGFAGAGLHDSIPIVKNEIVDIDYSEERINTDDEFRNALMRGIAKIGVEVETIMGGSPQDIEGCFKDGEFYVVQTRPQV